MFYKFWFDNERVYRLLISSTVWCEWKVCRIGFSRSRNCQRISRCPGSGLDIDNQRLTSASYV